MSVKTTPAQHQSNLRNVYGTFAIEGMTISKDTRRNLDRIGSGQSSYQQVVNYVPYDAAMQKKSPYWEGTYEACNIPFTDFQIRYQPEQIRIVDGKRILEDTAFLCRKDNDHFLILPSIYEKLDLDDWLLAHLFFYDKDGKRCIGVELSEVD